MDLAADPDFAAVLADMNCAVHRLHRRVREERNLVRLHLGDGARLGNVASVLSNARARSYAAQALRSLASRSYRLNVT
jgi:hypothetical protein